VIRLQAGVSYYVEALHKETTRGDYLSVAWRRGTDPYAEIRVIQGAVLIPFEEADGMGEAIEINAGDDVSVRWPIEAI
jgi:hypothetical protein